MATKAKIAANERRKVVAARYAQRRAELKAVHAGPSSTGEQRAAPAAEQRRPPRDAAAERGCAACKHATKPAAGGHRSEIWISISSCQAGP